VRPSGGALALLSCLVASSTASAHPLPPPARGPAPPELPNLIPEGDRASYRSTVIRVSPALRGLSARIVGGQDLLELTWRGRLRLTVLDRFGDPMFRVDPLGTEVNRASPSAWRATERFGRARVPSDASVGARPRWQRVSDVVGPQTIHWYEHRAHWMRPERPPVVGDGADRRTIRRWVVPVKVEFGGASRIEGRLEWIPARAAIRAARSDVSNPLLSALVLLMAMAVGAGIGVAARERVPVLRRLTHPGSKTSA